MMDEKTHKPIIETMINTAALALTATGTSWIVAGCSHGGLGFCLIAFGAGLEFFKYWGRQKNFW